MPKMSEQHVVLLLSEPKKIKEFAQSETWVIQEQLFTKMEKLEELPPIIRDQVNHRNKESSNSLFIQGSRRLHISRQSGRSISNYKGFGRSGIQIDCN